MAQPNVEFIRTPIAEFTIAGIVITDRRQRKIDTFIYCTGANRDMLPSFPITVSGVGSLQIAWTPDPYTYLGVATPSFPNLLFIQGPNSTDFSGTVPNQIETQTTCIALLPRKAAQQRITTLVPSRLQPMISWIKAMHSSPRLSRQKNVVHGRIAVGQELKSMDTGQAVHLM